MLVAALASACATRSAPRPEAPPTAPAADKADEPEPRADRDAQSIAVPAWIAILAEAAVEVNDEAGLEELARAASEEVATRLLGGLEGEQLDEARLSIELLMLLEWSAILGQEEEFRTPDFRRQVVLVALIGFERSLRGQASHEQLRRLRCDLFEGQVADLRRQAFASASDLFQRRIEPAAAAELGAGLRQQLDRADARSKELAGSCQEGRGAAEALANAWIDAGFLLDGDPCDVLTWDLYMLILGSDEQLPGPERVLGSDCTPNVLVFH